MYPNLKLLFVLFQGVSACHSSYLLSLNSRIEPNPCPWLHVHVSVFSLILFLSSVFMEPDEQSSQSVPPKSSSTSTNTTVTPKKNVICPIDFDGKIVFECFDTQFSSVAALFDLENHPLCDLYPQLILELLSSQILLTTSLAGLSNHTVRWEIWRFARPNSQMMTLHFRQLWKADTLI